DGVRVRIRLTPRASANRLAGLVAEADGGVALKIMVTAAAEQGKANEALIKLLAGTWHLAKSDISIIAGAGDRRKTLHVAGAAPRLLAVLAASVAGLAAP